MNIKTFKLSALAIGLAISANAFADGAWTTYVMNQTGMPLVLTATSSGTNGYCASNPCYPVVLPGGQYGQGVTIPNNSGWITLSYNLCQSVSYDASGKPQCNNYLVNFTVNINHNQSTISQNKYVSMQYDTKSTNFILSSNALPPAANLPQAQTYTSGLPFRGVNLSGFEFAPAQGGTTPYAGNFPTVADAVPFAQAGMNTFRIPLNWGYIQPTLGGALDSNYMQQVISLTQTLLKNGYNVIIDLHAYMRYSPDHVAGDGNVVSANDVSNVWTALTNASDSNSLYQLASQYNGKTAGKAQLIFDIMNEPNSMPTADVLANEQAGITAIRNNGLSNLVLLEGNSWTGLHSWTDNSGGTDGIANSTEFVPENITDPQHNYAINVHQYFDNNFSGTSQDCISASSQQDLLSQIHFPAFLTWLQDNPVPVIVTELGSGAGANCQQDIDWFLQALEQYPYRPATGNTPATGGFIGWTAWSGGHGWGTGYNLGLNPGDIAAPMLESTYTKHLTPLPSK